MKTVFMGTPDFASVILEYLYNSENSVELVITQPDRAKNRGKKVTPTPVKETALKHGTEVLQPEKIRGNLEIYERLKTVAPDIIIVAAYGQILPKEILELPEFGCVNVHASLLPRLRGASPIQQAIVRGEKVTGVTIMQMSQGLDTGDMLAKAQTEIGNLNASSLHDRLAEMGGRLLIETLEGMKKDEVNAVPQEESEATYAGLITKKDGKIDFSKSPEEIERLIRGFDPWPGAFCMYRGEQIKIWKAFPEDEKTSMPAGCVIEASEKGIRVSCGGRILNIKEMQAPGKKRLDVSDYLRGHSVPAGSFFE